MILLQKSQLNKICLTLSELENLTSPINWLFRFTLDQEENYEYLLFLEDISLFPQRYNLFDLVEGTDVTFKFIGDYGYEVYQMPNNTSTDFTLGLLVENGKMRLLETEVQTPTFTTNIDTPIYDSTNI
jgi:hypothetical protein